MESKNSSSVNSLLRTIEQQKNELQRSENELKKLIPDLRKEIAELRTQARILNERAKEVEKTVILISGMGTVATTLVSGNSYRSEPSHTRNNCPDIAVGGCIHHADSC